MRFCQAFMTELCRHIGADTDVPAGDIGVGGREIGYLFGQYKRLRNQFVGVLTGKGIDFGGSLIRPEATGYGVVYFASHMLLHEGRDIKGKTAIVSGSGNVAQYCVQKLQHLGAKAITLSDSSGYIVDMDGIDEEKLAFVIDLKNNKRGRISEYISRYPSAKFVAGQRPWGVKGDLILPCATQNEIDAEDAAKIVANTAMAVVEGANMPCTNEAISAIKAAKIAFGPSKAANAGGVAVSGLEMSQNSTRLQWTAEEVDGHLQRIMKTIFEQCVEAAKDIAPNDYQMGANIAGFLKVARAMKAQGLV
jgi:glutamate dehydrogenase (NADP+)